MPPCLLLEPSVAASHGSAPPPRMNARPTPAAPPAMDSQVALALRLAQRAFAALIENGARDRSARFGMFRSAQLRTAARRTLSALSADDRSRLSRWISLQVAASSARGTERVNEALARVDGLFAGRIGAALAQTRAELFASAVRKRADAGMARAS